MHLKGMIEAAVAAAMPEIGEKVKEIFVEKAQSEIDGTGNYIASIVNEGSGMEQKIFADPGRMSCNPGNPFEMTAEHGSFGNDYREGMTAILGDGACGSILGATRGTARYPFWQDIINETHLELPRAALAALKAQGLDVHLV